jgi:D-alanyl-D-alanine carboxypeptidase/D-alanyl-D-alanine-endopeptidase (penicillin-binding protein 4)
MHEAGRTLIELQGGFPRDCTRRAALQLIDRQELTERLFRTLWRGLGGTWAGSAVEAAAPTGSRLLARRESRPWGELLRHMNKASDNPRTRLLYLSLGLDGMAAEPQATTAELAGREVRRWLAEHGITDTGLVLDNGSGLSRSERITPLQLALMLKAAWRGRHAPELLMSLPVAGVDGTMRRRLQGSPAAGWARLKTGTLRNVVALAGYVNDADGRPWAVAMMINHDNASQARPVLDALVDTIARHGPHGPPPPAVGPQGDGP